MNPEIRAFASKTLINVVIETPKGRRNKYYFDQESCLFRLNKVLPAGATFPYDFGFVPGTRAEDGDPLDVLVLMDEPAFPGCLITARPIGVITAEQREKGKMVRNDRVVAVADKAHDYRHVRTLRDVGKHLVEELGYFFESYHKIRGSKFRVVGTHGARQALAIVKDCLDR
ncbi:MAG TPA: inorganic diphosphatase [Lacipirellulaceae bacterium]|nr:inorganic diphosphatase [Lacipirellulaceae bacterium]